MAADHGRPGDAHRDRGLDERALAQRERLAEDDARGPGPVERGDDDHDAPQARAEDRRQRETGDDRRDRQEHVRDAHQDVLDPAPVEAGDEADDHAEPDRCDVGEERDLEARASAVGGAREHVAAEPVGAEEVPVAEHPERQAGRAQPVRRRRVRIADQAARSARTRRSPRAWRRPPGRCASARPATGSRC